MLYGIRDNQKVKATQTGDRATCPFTGSELIAKCGYIKMNHWAYKDASEGIDYKGETEWHLEWKSRFDAEHCEVLHTDKFGFNHIADVDNGSTVYEFQHSPISSLELIQRELFYTSIGKKFIWVLDGRTFVNQEEIKSESYCYLTVKYLSRQQREAMTRSGYMRDIKWALDDKETEIKYTARDNDKVVEYLKTILKDYQLESMDMKVIHTKKSVVIKSRKAIYNISRSPIYIDLSHLIHNRVYNIQDKCFNTKEQLIDGIPRKKKSTGFELEIKL